ncbi:hypothetical protein BCR35DRAFT_325423 [Leucosporidium creatinivorum]|uniref:Polysaccharide lyase 14 domain-containing protein n=1 Tax=Leucosporidium creatinivorum TaxID=106004 RepID=A0A1Y2F3N1_9BASI|nr:hypothetical protein BCR35DRAFT_325423 [Leucosporidium creatinivorum]
MVSASFVSVMVLASYAAPALALPANIVRNSKVDSTIEARAAAAEADLQPRWVALSEDFVIPGSSKAVASSSSSSSTTTSVVSRSVAPSSLLDTLARNKKRSAAVKKLRKRATATPWTNAQISRAEAVSSALSILNARSTDTSDSVCTVTATSSSPSASATSVACSLTADCAGQTIPSNSHQYCASKVCSFRCNSGYTLYGSSCVKNGGTTTTSQPTTTSKATTTSKTTTTTTTTTTTKKATTTTTSAAASATSKTCSLTADCAGQSIPDSSHQYCDNKFCSFRCNSGYTLSKGACVKNKGTAAASTTTTTTTTTSAASSTATSNLGLTDGSTYWKQKTTFTSLASFVTDVVQKFTWGKDNTVVVQGVPASAWTDGVQGNTDSAIQVAYPAGSRNPSASPIGGVGFYSNKLDISAASNVSLSYSVFFEKGFDFVKGGKLPGLYGGATACSGGSAAESCFSTRLMFRTGGKGELYLYAPREKQVEALCTLGPLSYCNSVYGMSIGRGSWTFKTGEWTDIRQDIWLNTPGVADGGFNIWVNDELVLHSDSVYYRNSVVGQVVNNGTSTEPITLIDYDSLPDNITIPNGGFSTVPTESGTFSLPIVTKVVQPTGTNSRLNDPRPNPSDWAVKRNKVQFAVETEKKDTPAEPRMTVAPEGGRRRRSLALASEASEEQRVEKRATSTSLPTSFAGVMFHTFFGGSTSGYNSPTLQYSYFNGLALNINA